MSRTWFEYRYVLSDVNSFISSFISPMFQIDIQSNSNWFYLHDHDQKLQTVHNVVEFW